MPTEPKAGGAESVVIQLESWRWWLHFRPRHPRTPRRYSFQGEFGYVRTLVVEGRIVQPAARQGQAARIWISPTGQALKIGPHALRRLGGIDYQQAAPRDHQVSVLLPEPALETSATCLASVWKYLELRVFDADEDGASVSEFSFSATPPRRADV